jgi:serine protease Do
MRGWRIAALAGAVAVAAATGVAVTPVVHGQTKLLRTQSPRAVDVIVGGGSWIGVSIRNIEEADAKTLKGAATGVVVESVSTDSPAAKAGIRNGDVIVEFDGERVRSARQLTRLVQETPEGRAVQAVLLREGQRTPVTVTPEGGSRRLFERLDDDLGDFRFNVTPRAIRPPTPPNPPSPPSIFRFDELLGRAGALGVTVDTLSTQLAEYFGVKEGVLVTSVSDNSAAARAGVKAGDVITSLNGSAVNEPADLRRRMQNLNDGEEFTLQVMRDKKAVTLKGKVERPERGRRSRTIL